MDFCQRCKKEYEDWSYDEMKICLKCNRECCLKKCIALTGCQTTIGVCKDCFNYKCRICEITKLPVKDNKGQDIIYFDDYSPFDVCLKCKVNSSR